MSVVRKVRYFYGVEMIYTPEGIDELYNRYVGFDLLVDSRRVTQPGRTLFFALPGRRTHGAAFISELFGAGVRHFVVPGYQLKGARSQVQCTPQAP